MKARFLAADILEPKSSADSIDGVIDILHASAVLHVFGWAHADQGL